MMTHCGVLYNISHVGTDGLTPFERARGRQVGKPNFVFGEQILCKPVPVGRRKAAKTEPKLCDGLFLGLVERTGEIVIGTSEGTAERCRDFKRRPLGDVGIVTWCLA